MPVKETRVSREGRTIENIHRGEHAPFTMDSQRPIKKQKLELSDKDVDDSGSGDGSSISDHSAGNVKEENGFRINQEYARRFEHNKKREERHRREFSDWL